MAGLIIDAACCVGCRRCVRACATGGIVVEGRLARATDGCVLCGACVDACPVGAISIERDGAAVAAACSGIWVVAELDRAGLLAPVSLELTGRARELAQARGCQVTALVPAHAANLASAAARMLAQAGADEVVTCADARLAEPDAGVAARWVAALARDRAPEAVLVGATAWGRVLAPAIAVELRSGLTADCTMLDIDAVTGLLQQTRPAFGGNLMATIACPVARPQMATVRPGIFPVPDLDPARVARVDDVPLPTDAAPRVRRLSIEDPPAGPRIQDAEVLVVVGRGIGARKNLAVFERLAELLGAGLGCTRPLVEAGWLEYPHQVGQTGVAVAPRLLVSFGVSGAIQHLAGIAGAGTVVSVNEDPDAPIFGSSTYRVVGDAVEVASAIVAQLEASGA